MIKSGRFWIAALSVAAGAAWAQTPVERGRYLVEGILTCGNCHSPRGPGGVIDTARLYAGGPQVWDTPAYTVKGSNITPDKETGIGGWSAADVKRALREGKRPNGRQLSPQMPYAYYKIVTPADLDAVAAYLLQVPAVSNKVQAPVYKGPQTHVDVPPGAGLAEQMRAAGLDPGDVTRVVLSHAHFDHTGGIPDFPNATVTVSAAERHWVETGLRATDFVDLDPLQGMPR